MCQQVTEGTGGTEEQGALPKWLRLLQTSVRPWRLERKGLLRATETEFPTILSGWGGWGSLVITFEVLELKWGLLLITHIVK